ncbi:MAG: glycosyltransferase family 4 protein [Anaerolineales bacterium]
MRIGLIVPGFSAHEDDWATPALDDLTRTLAAENDVHVFALRYPHTPGEYRWHGARVTSLAGHSAAGLGSPLLWQRAVAALRREHAASPFDLLHAFWAYESGVVGALAARRLGAPLVISLIAGELERRPDLDYPVRSTGLRGHARYRHRRLLTRWALARAAQITGLSQMHVASIRRVLPPKLHERVVRLPFGVDLQRFRPAAGEVEIIGAQLLNVGALTTVKNQRGLVEAMPIILRQFPSAQLTLAGDGPLRAALAGRVHELGLDDHVVLAGRVPHLDMPALFRSHDLLVQTSHLETQGMALLEAAACGLPAVSMAVGAAVELGAGAVRIVEASAPRSVAGAVIDLLSNQPALMRTAQQARAVVEAEFALEICVRRWKRVYRDITARSVQSGTTPR